MIQIITGDKGKGKTKVLIDKVNNEVKVVAGSVVFIDNNNKHLYELSNRVHTALIMKLIIWRCLQGLFSE